MYYYLQKRMICSKMAVKPASTSKTMVKLAPTLFALRVKTSHYCKSMKELISKSKQFSSGMINNVISFKESVCHK